MSRQRAGHTPSAAKPNMAASRKRVRMVMVGILGLTLWAGFTAWGQMQQSAETSQRLEVLKAKAEETTDVNNKLKRELERMSDPEYREERIRKDNHMFKQGETVFDVPRSIP